MAAREVSRLALLLHALQVPDIAHGVVLQDTLLAPDIISTVALLQGKRKTARQSTVRLLALTLKRKLPRLT